MNRRPVADTTARALSAACWWRSSLAMSALTSELGTTFNAYFTALKFISVSSQNVCRSDWSVWCTNGRCLIFCCFVGTKQQKHKCELQTKAAVILHHTADRRTVCAVRIAFSVIAASIYILDLGHTVLTDWLTHLLTNYPTNSLEQILSSEYNLSSTNQENSPHFM